MSGLGGVSGSPGASRPDFRTSLSIEAKTSGASPAVEAEPFTRGPSVETTEATVLVAKEELKAAPLSPASRSEDIAVASHPTDLSSLVTVISSLAQTTMQQAIDTREEMVARENGLTLEEYRNIKVYVQQKRETGEWKNFKEPFVVRSDQLSYRFEGGRMLDNLGQEIIKSGLSRSLAVVPQEDGNFIVYVLLKQHGGMKPLGTGEFKKVTWLLDLDTGARNKVFATERREKFKVSAPHQIKDSEIAANKKYAGIPGFVAGRVVVRYQHKTVNRPGGWDSGAEKRGFILDAMEDLTAYLAEDDSGRHLPSKNLSPREVNSIAFDVSLGVAIMHAMGDMHLDLKPGNIYTDKNKRAHIGDLGTVRPFNTLLEITGSPAYVSPEIVNKRYGEVDGKADVWSLGMILYDLKKGIESQAAWELSYVNENQIFLPAGVKDENINKAALEDWKRTGLPERDKKGTLDWVIAQCVQYNAKERPTMMQVMTALAALDPASSLDRATQGWESVQEGGKTMLRSPPISKGEKDVTEALLKSLGYQSQSREIADPNEGLRYIVSCFP